MSDNKQLSFSISIDGVSNEGSELAKLEFQLSNLKKAKQELMKTAEKEGFLSNENKLKLAAYNKEITAQTTKQKELKKVVDSSSDSLTRKRALLIQLKEQYANAGQEAATKMIPTISKLTAEVSKAEQAIGVHQRGVGNYKGAIMDAGKQLIGFTSIAAGVIMVLNKMKDAFKQTEQGAKFFGKATEVLKTVFQSVVTGGNVFELVSKIKIASQAADDLNQIRIDDRKELIEIAKMETEIEKLRYKAADATLSEKEQLSALIEAQRVEDELIKFKIADKQEELKAIEKVIAARNDDTDALNKYYQIQAEIIEIEGERNLRLETRATALREKISKMSAESGMAFSEINKLVKYVTPGDDLPAELKAAQFIEDEKQRIWEEGMQKARENHAANKQLAQEQANSIIDIELAKLDYKQELADAEIAIAGGIAYALKELSGKNKAMAFTALAIEKASAIAQIISNISIANAKAIAKAPLTLGQPWVAINTGLGAVSIASVIGEAVRAGSEISQYATGGKINKGFFVNTGGKDDTLIMANKTETVLTQDHVRRLGGSGVMKRIGVPGYAEGGYLGSQAPEIPSMGFDYSKLAEAMRQNLKVTLNVNELNSAQNELNIINQTLRI